jgi:hypothetical protein
MKKAAAQTILPWLKHNGIPLGALTHHDVAALFAAVQIAELWIRGDYDYRNLSRVAFYSVVMQMQESTRHMAFHAIAHVGDWCHRPELWYEAGLSILASGYPECTFAPRRAAHYKNNPPPHHPEGHETAPKAQLRSEPG